MPAQAESEAAMIDRVFLRPHNSKISGQMVMSLKQWYGIEPLWTLTILGAESSMADPELGGRLVTEALNFGCMRAGSFSTPWGRMASGTIEVAGRTWFVFPDVWKGMVAWGRLIKVGPETKPGYYIAALKAGKWTAWAEVYYGRYVQGFDAYLANVLKIRGNVRAKALRAGYIW